MAQYHDGQEIQLGDRFTTVMTLNPESNMWEVTHIQPVCIKSIGAEPNYIHSYPLEYDFSHWKLVSRHAREKTGFGKFIQRIEA